MAHFELLEQMTEVASEPPNLNGYASLRFLPLMVTWVPPFSRPLPGLTPLTTGAVYDSSHLTPPTGRVTARRPVLVVLSVKTVTVGSVLVVTHVPSPET